MSEKNQQILEKKRQIILNLDADLFEESESVRKLLRIRNRNKFWREVMRGCVKHFEKKKTHARLARMYSRGTDTKEGTQCQIK